MGDFVRPGHGHVILFQHQHLHGEHVHVFRDEQLLKIPLDGTFEINFDNITSSIVVLEGTWEFFKENNFVDKLGELGPGQYPDVTLLPEFGWKGDPSLPNGAANDAISSLKVKPCDPITW